MKHYKKTKIFLMSIGIIFSLLSACLTAKIFEESPTTVTGWVGHTQLVYREIQSVLIAALDGETGQRGYIITDNDKYLTSYLGSKERVERHIVRLARLTRDNSTQQQLVGELQVVLENKYAELASTLVSRTKEGREAAIRTINDDSGLKYMNQARVIVSKMMRNEDELLAIRNNQSYNMFYCILFCMVGLIVRDSLLIQAWRKEDDTGTSVVADENDDVSQSGQSIES